MLDSGRTSAGLDDAVSLPGVYSPPQQNFRRSGIPEVGRTGCCAKHSLTCEPLNAEIN